MLVDLALLFKLTENQYLTLYSKESIDENTLPDIVPFKPKKDVEDPIIVQINNELNEYNLECGDLFIGNFTTNNKNIAAFILIYGTLKPTIRYYHIK
jgi:hypothetical protein